MRLINRHSCVSVGQQPTHVSMCCVDCVTRPATDWIYLLTADTDTETENIQILCFRVCRNITIPRGSKSVLGASNRSGVRRRA